MPWQQRSMCLGSNTAATLLTWTCRAGGRVLTCSKEPDSPLLLKPFTGSEAQKWVVNNAGELVNARWPEMVRSLRLNACVRACTSCNRRAQPQVC